LKNPIFSDASVSLETFEECDKKITIEILPDYHTVYHRHKGNYENLSEHWGAFQEKYAEYITEDTLMLERTYDDPSITDTDECLYDLYMTVSEYCGLPNTTVIQGGKFAVYHFKGPVKQIYTAYQSIFNVWLPGSNEKIDERYGFEIYRLIDCDTMNMAIDICIPIK
jgi:AraC family transcriptional regulator